MSVTLADCSEVLSEMTTHLCAARMLLMWLWWIQRNDKEDSSVSSLCRWNTLNQQKGRSVLLAGSCCQQNADTSRM